MIFERCQINRSACQQLNNSRYSIVFEEINEQQPAPAPKPKHISLYLYRALGAPVMSIS